MQGAAQKIIRVLGPRQFFYGALAFFALESLWVALSARYPMAFDEDFHLGIIKVYSQHLLPFLHGQPDGANAYGSLATDPSYLYHYVMSFPYRIIKLITDNQAAQVIVLRCINIGIFGAGIWLFRKLLIRIGTSPALANAAVTLFVLVPIVPLMAGQINYDSMFILMLAWTCWLAFSITEALRARRVSLALIGLLAIVCLLGCLVKYPFLPVAVATAAYLAVVLCVMFRGRNAELVPAIHNNYRALTRGTKIALAVGLLVSAGLFVQRYGVNIAKYHDPVPNCDAVIGVEACQEYSPWARDHFFSANPIPYSRNPVLYTWTWLQSLHYRMFFMVNGPPDFVSYPPSPLPSAAAIVVLLSGVIALLLYWRQVFAGRPFLLFLLGMTLLYAGILWAQNYSAYLSTTRPVAINGRYLVPFLLPMTAVFGRAFGIAFARWRQAKVWMAVVAIVCFLQGGGTIGFISRSDASWYWQNRLVVNANQSAQRVVDALIFEGPKYY